MKVEKKITTFKSCELDIRGITLLSREEYEENHERIRDIVIQWWLRSSRSDTDIEDAGYEYAPYVQGGGVGGRVSSERVDYNHLAVRPALILNDLNSSNLVIGNGFHLFGFNWTIISTDYALCDTFIGNGPFRKDAKARDANDFQASDVKKFVEKWWNEKTKIVCPTCQTELPQEAQFCIKCGTKVHAQGGDECKVKKIITTFKSCELDIKGITLLSKEEYEENRERICILVSNAAWWLRSPGGMRNLALIVGRGGGDVLIPGVSVYSDVIAVRPALILNNLNSSNLVIGNSFRLFGINWTIISTDYALCDTFIGNGPFRKELGAKDANDYQASDVKKFVEKWWNERTKPVCPVCQTELPQGAQFCFKCGTKVE